MMKYTMYFILDLLCVCVGGGGGVIIVITQNDVYCADDVWTCSSTETFRGAGILFPCLPHAKEYDNLSNRLCTDLEYTSSPTGQ